MILSFPVWFLSFGLVAILLTIKLSGIFQLAEILDIKKPACAGSFVFVEAIRLRAQYVTSSSLHSQSDGCAQLIRHTHLQDRAMFPCYRSTSDALRCHGYAHLIQLWHWLALFAVAARYLQLRFVLQARD